MGGGVAPETQTITRAVPLVSFAIGDPLATTLGGRCLHPAGLADTHLLAVDCMEQVTADVRHAARVACPRVEPGPATRWQDAGRLRFRSYRLSDRNRLCAADDILGHSARDVRDRGAVGYCAQRRLHAIQTLSQLS